MKFDEEKDKIERVFSHSESSSRVLVGVERVKSIFKAVPDRLRIAISLSSSLNDAFDDVDRSEAQTIYGKSWKLLSVGKYKLNEDRIYSFEFACSK